MSKFITTLFISVWLISPPVGAVPAHADGTDVYARVLKQIDGLVCTQPAKIAPHYSSKLVIMVDDKRALLENRIKDYQLMQSEMKGLKCSMERKILAGKAGDNIGYVLADELISVTADTTDTDERQHSVCSYVFTKEGEQWKISLEHCTSLPDYTIRPGDDALYYFHNPVY